LRQQSEKVELFSAFYIALPSQGDGPKGSYGFRFDELVKVE